MQEPLPDAEEAPSAETSPQQDLPEQPDAEPAHTPTPEQVSTPEPPTQQEPAEPHPANYEDSKKAYWKQILTGNPATVPASVRRKTGVDDWDAPEEQKEYRLLATVNKSWAADHLPCTREQISSSWPKQRAELTRKLGVQDNEHELFLALSDEQDNAPRREAASQIFSACFMAGLDGESFADIRPWTNSLSTEDARNAATLANSAFTQGQQTRQKMMGLAQRIAHGLESFAAMEEDAIIIPRLVDSAPDLIQAIDELADLDETQCNTALYLATDLVQKQNKNADTPGLLSRTIQAMRRGASRIGTGTLQAMSNAGIATLNKLGKQLGSDTLSGAAAAWDKRMQLFNKLQNLSQQELRPLVLPHEAHKAASYLITAAEAVPSALLSCCGGIGFSALTLGAVGDSVAEARNRAPLASQELQLYAGLLAGAIQAGIYMNLNRIGGRLLEQSISRIGRAGGQGIAGYTLAGLNVMGSSTAEAAKMLAAGKLANAVDLGAQEVAARLSQTASNINWKDFGENLTDVEANMHEAAALLPFLLLGSGRLALQHFRSPRAILGEGKLLGDWGVPEEQQQAIFAERNMELQSRMLQEAISGSKLWGGLESIPSAWRALRLLHSDSFKGFEKIENVHDFLQLPPPERHYTTTDAARKRPPYKPEQAGSNQTLANAMTLWNEWWTRSRINSVPAPYPNADIFRNIQKTPSKFSLKSYQALNPMLIPSQLPRRVRELGIYAPHAEAERKIILNDRIADLEALSYQFLMNLYSVDTLTRDPQRMTGWRAKTERSRACLLGAVARAVVSTACGATREEALKGLSKYVSDFFVRRKYKGVRATWIRDSNFKNINKLPQNADSFFLAEPAKRPEELEAYRIVSGLKAHTDALIDLLPLTTDFQTALTRGLSPAAAYVTILNRELALPEGQLQLDDIKLSKDIKNITPMLQYTWENTSRFNTYCQLSGNTIERTLGGDTASYSRICRPNGALTHWHSQDEHVMNDVAGNAALLFLPFGHNFDMINLHTQNGSDVNLLNTKPADDTVYTPYDQLCSQAREELIQFWNDNITDIQPGLRLERMRKFVRVKKMSDGITPLVYEDGEPGHNYKIDDFTQATPLSVAQGRFYVYWQRVINSGILTPEEVGNFLVKNKFITAAERKAILNPPLPVIYYWRKNKNVREEAYKARLDSIPRNMAEKMAEFTTLRFLSQMRTLDIPSSVKEWVGMAAFCPDIQKKQADLTQKGRKILSIKSSGPNYVIWANRTSAQKLRDLAPQIDMIRKRYENSPVKDALFEGLMSDAMGVDSTMRCERGWCFYKSGLRAAMSAPQSYWNMLRFPRRTWERMSEEERAPYRERLEALCKHEPMFIDPERPAASPVDAAINMLDELLQTYPQMHLYSTEKSRLDRLRIINLDNRNEPTDEAPEPSYSPIPFEFKQKRIQKGFEVQSLKSNLPDFFTADSRVFLGITLLDELRAFQRNLPHAFNDGIWWKGELYGYGGKDPLREGEFYPERPIEPLINMLQAIGSYEAEHGPMKVCGIQLKGLDADLNLRPFQAITIYRAKSNRRMVYRLMPGNPSAINYRLQMPYLVHCRDGVYLNSHAVVRSSDDMINVLVPLHKFSPQAKRDYKMINQSDWTREAWNYNIDHALMQCAKAAAPSDKITHHTAMMEYLMRLTEDSGFSPSIAELDPRTLNSGQATLLNLARDMIMFLCSPESETQSQEMAKLSKRLNTTKTRGELISAIRRSNASIPAIKKLTLSDMEAIFNQEFDKLEQENATTREPKPSPENQP